jgi:hypothetical protein
MTQWTVRLLALAVAVFLPAAAFAQATLAGVVRDTSGAVLPGVVVEAASPVLIEKVRSAVTDGNGRYQIIDLRPGTYGVTFTLAGFATVRRDAVALAGASTVTVDAEMRIGSLEETVTVSGAAPVVDVASATRQTVLDRETVQELPTGRNYQNLGILITGVNTNRTDDVGGSVGDTMAQLSVHGSRGLDQRITVNGVNVSTLQGGGNTGGMTQDVSAATEVVIETSAVGADQPTGGVRINLIPRDGGNTFAGSNFFSFTNESMVGDNLTERLQGLGLTSGTKVLLAYDVNPAFGGPLVRDRFWFWLSGRQTRADNQPAGIFHNKNAYDATKWTYEPDTSRPAKNTAVNHSLQFRGTIQANANNKFAFTWMEQNYCRCPNGVSATLSPESAPDRRAPRLQQQHAEWTSPVTSRLLIEAVGMHLYERWGNMNPRVGDGGFFTVGGSLTDQAHAEAQRGLIPVLEQSTGMTYHGGAVYVTNTPQPQNTYWNTTRVPNYYYRAAVSYVTGTHNIKVGFNRSHGFVDTTQYQFQPYTYRFNNGVPNQVTVWATPFTIKANLDNDLGIFAQDRVTLDRLTLSGGIRFDTLQSSYPEQTLGPGVLVPNRNLTFPAADNLDWKDVSYRSAATWDVFGSGRTAVKVTLNKYLQSQGVNGLATGTSPTQTLVNSATRSWVDANGNYVPDCVLDGSVPGANGECGAISNRDFGAVSSRPAATFSEDLLTGWGNRSYNWEFSTSVQHEIAPRVSVDVGYFRRWFGNFQVTDNLALTSADFDAFSLTLPTDERLGENSGRTVDGLYDLKASAFGRPAQSYNTLSDEYGKQIEHWNGADVTVVARLEQGLTLQAGISTGKRTQDNCEIVAQLPEVLEGADLLQTGNNGVWLPAGWCHQEEPFLTNARLFGSYTIPRIDVLLSGTFVSSPGPLVAANYTASNAILASTSTLGRTLSGNAANMRINIAEPGSLYVERLNQLDLRVGKVLRFGRTRATVNLDIYNALNADTVRAINSTYTSWTAQGYRPTAALVARFLKVSGTFDF